MESVDKRKQDLLQWLNSIREVQVYSLDKMISDASFRRYFRIMTPEKSFLAMDAPPLRENCQNFVVIAQALRKIGINAPEIIAANIEQGFLLITDFGDTTYLKMLNPHNANQLYEHALQTLAVMQKIKHIPEFTIPFFDSHWMWQEWAWYKEWFLHKFLHFDFIHEEKKLDECFSLIVQSATQQPQVFMHRDYHSANLMVLENDVGVLDFQDAFIGPVTYDLVSLLRDCYINWPEEIVQQWTKSYWQMLIELRVLKDVEFSDFLRWFDLMGLERHLKALFTFSRIYVRDQQSHYIKHIPRTLNYLMQVTAQYAEFSPLNNFLVQIVQPTFAKEILCLP